MTDVAAAINAFKPEIAARYDRIVRNGFANVIEKFGPTARGVANSELYRFWSETIRPCTKTDSDRVSASYSIDEDRLAAKAAAYADAVAVSWIDKINAKVGELEDAKVVHLNGARFMISGNRAGRPVRIEQDMIVNVSSKGTVFNQFPARIYVGGKFTSAAAYAKLFA